MMAGLADSSITDPALMVKRAVKWILGRLGLGGVARRLRGRLRVRGPRIPLVPVREFAASCELVIRSLQARDHVFGDYLEFGVSRGTSMACMAQALSAAGLADVRLIGFDSFRGMPRESAGQGWAPGEYSSPIKATRAYLRSENANLDRVELVKGWFKDTLNQGTADALGLNKASIVMVDCDIYTASKEALWFIEPLIRDEAVIIFDDWGWRADIGEIGQQEAYTEFLETFLHFISEPLPAYRPEARIFRITRKAMQG